MTKIKICGITNLEDALAATHAGADLLGFIFYEPSPRYVEPEQAKTIISAITSAQSPEDQAKTPQFVGVFVNEPLEKIDGIFKACHLDRIQLHGEWNLATA